jgi:hypothetical protein
MSSPIAPVSPIDARRANRNKLKHTHYELYRNVLQGASLADLRQGVSTEDNAVDTMKT